PQILGSRPSPPLPAGRARRMSPDFLRQSLPPRPRPPARIRAVACWLALVVAAALGSGTALAAKQKASVQGIRLAREGTTLVLSFDLLGAWTPEVKERLNAGRSVEFTCVVQFLRKRGLWGSRTVAEQRFLEGLRFDAVPRQFTLTRRL